MKKLKNKMFFTLFTILTLFLLTLLFLFNYQDYHQAKSNVQENLSKMNNDAEQQDMSDPKQGKQPDASQAPKQFIDAVVYTVLLNENNDIIDIISHTADETAEEDIRQLALQIIEKNDSDTTWIGNLYVETYSYKYLARNCIILIDNTDTNQRLSSSLKTSLLLMLILEIAIYAISRLLVAWMIQPVETSFRRQKQFIADASHELKTPLSVIMASAEALEDDRSEAKWLHNIQDEAERMNHLIADLLDLARLENDTNTKCFQPVNLSKLTEMSILTLESRIYEKNIHLEYDIGDAICFDCDSDEIKRLLFILLDNGINHTGEGGRLLLRLREDGNRITLEVKNEGDAIPKGAEEKIFERFYRLDESRNRNENHYGLGLAIAKSIVSNYQGEIFASSAAGYTTFTVLLKNNQKK